MSMPHSSGKDDIVQGRMCQVEPESKLNSTTIPTEFKDCLSRVKQGNNCLLKGAKSLPDEIDRSGGITVLKSNGIPRSKVVVKVYLPISFRHH